MTRILVTIPANEAQRAQIIEAAPGRAFDFIPAAELTEVDVAGREIILGNVPVALLKGANALQWIQLNNAGTEGFTGGALPAGAILTNATGAYGIAIAEHTLAMILMLIKKLDVYRQWQREGAWRDAGHVRAIDGSTALIVGAGDIGMETARRMKAFGARVLCVKRTAGEKPDYVDELYAIDELDRLLPRADFVCLSMPGNPATRGMFGRERLALMKPDAIITNVGRGSAIDTEALIDALAGGRLGGAALDVTDPEPLAKDHPLWSAPNCLVTPHVSGQYHLPDTLERIVRLCARNLRAHLAGQPLESVVDMDTGYARKR